MSDSKKIFIEKFVKPTLMAADRDIADVKITSDEKGLEIVTVFYSGGGVKNVNVTADSNLATLKDIAEALDM